MATGPTGPAGPEGEEGLRGPEGPEGLRGPAGPAGPQGSQGVQGVPGPVGPQGAAGPAGGPGITGATGATGAAGISPCTQPAYGFFTDYYSIDRLDPNTHEVNGTADVPRMVYLASDPGLRQVYAVNEANNLIVILNADTMTVKDTVSGAGVPLAVNPVTHVLYATDGGNIVVIDGISGQVLNTVPSGFGSIGAMAADPVTNSLYLSSTGGSTVGRYSGNTLALDQSWSLSDPVLALKSNTCNGSVYAWYHTAGGEKIASLEPSGAYEDLPVPYSLYYGGIWTIDSSRNLLYVQTGATTVDIFSLCTDQSVGTMEIATAATGITVDSATQLVYVASSTSIFPPGGSVIVYDALTRQQVGSTITDWNETSAAAVGCAPCTPCGGGGGGSGATGPTSLAQKTNQIKPL